MLNRKHFELHGDVQGVGLRFRARQAAALYGCTGWVRNEYDGSVTLELQGTEAQIQAVMRLISKGTYIHIDGMDTRSLSPDPEERGFRTLWA